MAKKRINIGGIPQLSVDDYDTPQTKKNKQVKTSKSKNGTKKTK